MHQQKIPPAARKTPDTRRITTTSNARIKNDSTRYQHEEWWWQNSWCFKYLFKVKTTAPFRSVQRSAGKTATVLFIQLGIRTLNFLASIMFSRNFGMPPRKQKICKPKENSVQELRLKHSKQTSVLLKNTITHYYMNSWLVFSFDKKILYQSL
jgi:hypothetical protein